MSQNKDKLVAAYIPVIHQGYLDLFNRHSSASIAVFDNSIVSQFDYLRKDIRTLQPEMAVRAIQGLGFNAQLLSLIEITGSLEDETVSLVLADDDLSHSLVNTADTKATIVYEPVFLRWDRKNTNENSIIIPDKVIPVEQIITAVDLKEMYDEASRSTDWWRHVSAAVIDKNHTLLSTHNRAMPQEYTNSIEGDPRIIAKKGESIEKSLFIHAEADLIAQMAKEGIRTEGKELFVTTFPCPNCARLIAASGFNTCYFIEGYAMLDGQRILSDAGVTIVQVTVDTAPKEPVSRLRQYPEK